MGGASPALDRESFGLVLRAGRERRQVSLNQLSSATKVRTEVWEALEANDFSEWPNGIYARSLIRQYAEWVELDPESLVNEFCRLFPNGDRRAEPLLHEYAAIVAHDFESRNHAATPCRRATDGTFLPEPGRVGQDGFERAGALLQQWTRRRATAVMMIYRTARTWSLSRGVARGA